MLRFISKLNDDLKEQLFILCSATSRYLATITAQLMLRNVVSNSFVTPEYVKTWRLAKLNYPLRNSMYVIKLRRAK